MKWYRMRFIHILVEWPASYLGIGFDLTVRVVLLHPRVVLFLKSVQAVTNPSSRIICLVSHLGRRLSRGIARWKPLSS
jgi:hypothetical protein